jgi:hypothetical protein
MRKLLLLLCSIVCLSSCHHNKANNDDELTPNQNKLIENGWKLGTPSGGEFDEAMGIKPIYGIEDNYFDITVGNGFDVALKIVDFSTDKCIRYVYVPQNETVTINQIPQGKYYIKLAYGQDWMEYETDSVTLGKFTDKTFFEKSNVFDFGVKNSQQIFNYELEINVIDGTAKNNFHTVEIDETEFEKN